MGSFHKKQLRFHFPQQEKVLKHLHTFKIAEKTTCFDSDICQSCNTYSVYLALFNYILYSVKEHYRCCVIGADVAMQPNRMVFKGMNIFTSLLSSQNGCIWQNNDFPLAQNPWNCLDLWSAWWVHLIIQPSEESPPCLTKYRWMKLLISIIGQAMQNVLVTATPTVQALQTVTATPMQQNF